ECGFSPGKETRAYPGAPEQVEARQNLHRLVAEAREEAVDPVNRGNAIAPPEALHPVPGTKVANLMEPADDLPPQVSPDEVRGVLDRAMSLDSDVQMVYHAKNGQRLTLLVQPQRLAFKAESPVLVGLDRDEGERRTFVLDRIERLRIVE
ncbi:MAG: WYL domain-containing protein, partial [Proteobacteria bacterium]|nr:WYL domain-containing protein [Pseudomonadota bacterium]